MLFPGFLDQVSAQLCTVQTMDTVRRSTKAGRRAVVKAKPAAYSAKQSGSLAQSSNWLSQEELDTLQLLTRAVSAVESKLDDELRNNSDVDLAYYDILWQLRSVPSQSLRMGRLVELCHSKASRMSHAIRRLEELGFLYRVRPESDYRGWMAVLTPQGLKSVERAASVYANSVRTNLLDHLTPEDQERLKAVETNILTRLDPKALPGSADINLPW